MAAGGSRRGCAPAHLALFTLIDGRCGLRIGLEADISISFNKLSLSQSDSRDDARVSAFELLDEIALVAGHA